MVNHEIKNNPQPCLPVSLEFFDEMLGCVPPQFWDNTDELGCYTMMQVGEAADHNAQGLPIYETYQRMNQTAVDQSLADSRMKIDQWYFVGLQTDQNKK